MIINQLHLKPTNHLGFVLSLVKQGDEHDEQTKTGHKDRKKCGRCARRPCYFFCICFLKTRNPWFLHYEALG